MASLMSTSAATSEEPGAAVRYIDMKASLIDFSQESSLAAVRDIGNRPIR